MKQVVICRLDVANVWWINVLWDAPSIRLVFCLCTNLTPSKKQTNRSNLITPRNSGQIYRQICARPDTKRLRNIQKQN